MRMFLFVYTHLFVYVHCVCTCVCVCVYGVLVCAHVYAYGGVCVWECSACFYVCMCVCVIVCVCEHTCVYACVYLCMCVFLCISVYVASLGEMNIHVCVHVCAYLCACVHLSTCVHTCMHMCVFLYICLCVYLLGRVNCLCVEVCVRAMSSSITPPTHFVRQSLSLNLELTDWLEHLSCKLQDLPVPSPSTYTCLCI